MRKKGKRSRRVKALVLFGLLLILVLILVVSTVGRREFNTPHKLSLEVLGQAQSGITAVTGYLGSFWDKYVNLWGIREENRQLREELGRSRAQNTQYREAVATNIRLAKLLELKESLPPPTISAQIVGRDPSLWFKTVIIDRGSSDGVQQGMPVVTVEGVVGQVMNTSPRYAKVLLANDPNSAIDVIIQPTRVQGIIKGLGIGYQLHYILKNSNVQEGDQIVTSGLGGVFPKGLPVGKVSKVVKNRRGMFQDIEITPTVDFSELEFLIIILKENSLAD